MKINSIKNYLKNLKEKKVMSTTSEELKAKYSFIEGIDKVRGNYYSKISKIIDLMALYAKNNSLIDENDYFNCIFAKNQSYEGLKGVLGDISMIINEKEFMQSENIDYTNQDQRKMLASLCGDPDLEKLVNNQK